MTAREYSNTADKTIAKEDQKLYFYNLKIGNNVTPMFLRTSFMPGPIPKL